MIKSNKENTVKTRETYFFHRKSQKLEIAKNIFPKLSPKTFIEYFSFLSLTRIVPKKRKVTSYRNSNE